MVKNNGIQTNVHETSNLDNSERRNSKNSLITFSTVDGLFNSTTINFLHQIYRSVKIRWTKENGWAYSSSPHLVSSEQLHTLMPVQFFTF